MCMNMCACVLVVNCLSLVVAIDAFVGPGERNALGLLLFVSRDPTRPESS